MNIPCRCESSYDRHDYITCDRRARWELRIYGIKTYLCDECKRCAEQHVDPKTIEVLEDMNEPPHWRG